MSRKLAEIITEMEATTCSGAEEDFEPQRFRTKRGSSSGQTWKVDVGKEWISNQHQGVGVQVTINPLEKGLTRNTARSWWIALDTMKELESCLRKLDRGVTRKRQNWETQQKAEVNKLELKNRLGRTWEKLLLEYFEDEMRTPSSAPPLMMNPFVRTEGQLMLPWCLEGVAFEELTSAKKLKLSSVPGRDNAGTL